MCVHSCEATAFTITVQPMGYLLYALILVSYVESEPNGVNAYYEFGVYLGQKTKERGYGSKLKNSEEAAFLLWASSMESIAERQNLILADYLGAGASEAPKKVKQFIDGYNAGI